MKHKALNLIFMPKDDTVFIISNGGNYKLDFNFSS